MSALFPSRIALILALSAITGWLQAQDIDSVKTWSEAQFAQKMTDQMAPRVPLAADQIAIVYRINLKFAGLVLPVVNGTAEPKSKLAQVKEFDAQRSKELEVFLNPEQMRQVRQLQRENRAKMKQHYYEKHL